MAKDLNRSIKIYIDNSDAMSNAEKLRGKITELEGSLKKLAAQGQKDSAGYNKQQKQLDQNTRAYAKYQNRVQETERVLKNLSGATHQELYAVRRTLRREVQQATRGTEDYSRKLKMYNRVQKEITVTQREMNSQYGRQNTLMGKMAGGFNKYFGMATAFIASITGVSFAFRRLSQDAAAMEDTYADVMKTTGLTREEVGELNDELKKMDTRTAREQLNLLARDAGKLGMDRKKDILDFVEAGNIINVALGEDLGEDAIKSIGKMSNVFQKATKEIEKQDLKGRMLAIGSAVNEVAQSSTAAEPYLVSFAGRMGGVSAQAGIGIDKILGYASALDQDMQSVEMSATALQKFIITIMKEPSEFAKYAKMEVSEFSNLLKTDANEAIKLVLRSFNEQGGFQELIPIFDKFGLSGARSVGVLTSMASSIDKIDEAQAIANKSMIEATSVVDEYNIKNENAQAQLEKRQKAFKDAAEELGQRLNPALLKSTNILTYIIKAMPAVLDFFQKYGKYILYLASSYAIYMVAVKAQVLWETKLNKALTLSNIQMVARNTVLKALRISTLAYNVVLGLVTGNFTMMRRAWNLLTASMATNPFGLIAVAITAAVVGIVKLVKWINKTDKATKLLKETTKQFNSELAEEQRKMDDLFKVLKRTNPESELHKKIRKEILDQYGPYIRSLIDEEGRITDIGIAHEMVNNNLREQIALKIRNQAMETSMADYLNTEVDNIENVMERIKNQVGDDSRVLSDIRDGITSRINEFRTSEEQDFDGLKKSLNSFLNAYEAVDINVDDGINTFFTPANLRKRVGVLVDGIEEGKIALDEIDERFGSMITTFNNKYQLNANGTGKGSGSSCTGKGEESDLSETEEERKERLKKEAEDYEKYLKQKLAMLDSYMEEEKNKLMQQRLEGGITQEQYLRDLEALEMEGMIRKMDIYKIGSDQQIAIQNLIYDKKIKILQKLESDELAYQKRLLDNQKAADKARAEQNWANLEAIGKQNEQDAKEKFEKQQKQKQELFEIGMDFSNEMGSMVGGLISGNEDIVASSLKSIINMGLDMLKVQVQMAVAGATAMSLAQPDSVLTFGAAGFARAAIMVGLIEGAFAAVKGVVSSAVSGLGKSGGITSTISEDALTGQRVVTQRRDGKYDVIGVSDGRMYSNVPYIGDAQTGVVSTPTLMGEYGSELVVNAPDFKALQRHVNYPVVLEAIQQSRQPYRTNQRAEGNYSQLPPSQSTSPTDNDVMVEMIALLRDLKANGVKAPVVLSELQRKQELLSTSQKIGSK